MPVFFALTGQDIGPFLPWVGVIIAGFAIWGSLKACRRRRLIDDLPTSKTHGVFIGLVEIKGSVRCAEPLTSYLAEAPCVHYAYDIEERWSKTVTTTESDGKGGTRTVTRRESGWTSVASDEQMTPFYLEDDTGLLLVRPQGARIEALSVFSQSCSVFDPLYYGKGPAGGIMHSDGVRRFSERAIPLEVPLFVVGQARERQDIVAPEIAADVNASDFLVSVRSEEEISNGLGWQIALFFLLGLVAMPGGHWASYLAVGQEVDPLGIVMFLGEAILFTLVWTAGWVVTVYNSLVELRQRVEQGWGQVEIQLKRRHDLIPNLVDCVKGIREYEASTQAALAEMRSQLNVTAPGQPGADAHSLSVQVSMLREAYPELKVNENFLALQTSLSDTEQRIALARAYFNDIATFWNTRLEVVPDRYIASLGAMRPRELMEANDFERAPVQVSFAEKQVPVMPPA